ncbi:MAG: hypothetical protein ACRENY_04270 [Candidatus Dormibacteria bacterium]
MIALAEAACYRRGVGDLPIKQPLRAQLVGLVGSSAATLAYRARRWELAATLVVLVGLALLWSSATARTGEPQIWALVIDTLLTLAAVGCWIAAARCERLAGRAASRFVSVRLGRPVTVQSGRIRLGGWQSNLRRAATLPN